MSDKINNLKDLQYYGNIELLSNVVLEALKKQETPKLVEMSKAISQITFYVNNLQEDLKMYNRSMSEYRQDKIRAIERARTAEKKIEKLEEELKKFNIFNT
jgi:chromosome segregation ATPase